MKKEIAILGSTGSIGKNLISIINQYPNQYEIKLLTANKDYKTLLKQAKKFKVKNLIITNLNSYEKIKKQSKKLNIKIFKDFNNLNKIFKKKINYTLSAITGIEGLVPTLNLIKYSEIISIANKESIICAWNLINKEIVKNKTEFIPLDSEHFSLWFSIQGQKIQNVKEFFLTASGGPFYNFTLNKLRKAKISDAINHPNWKMGKKISIDSATMINKVYEVIEAKNIFNISHKKIKILVHPKSYIHAIVKFNNGLIKLIAHDTTMKIPIFNSINTNNNLTFKTKDVNIDILNNLEFSSVNLKKYPMVKILKLLPDKPSLYETVIVSANDTLVSLFLDKKITFLDIHKNLLKIIKLNEFLKYKKISPKNVKDIIKLNQYVRLKCIRMSI